MAAVDFLVMSVGYTPLFFKLDTREVSEIDWRQMMADAPFHFPSLHIYEYVLILIYMLIKRYIYIFIILPYKKMYS